VQLPEICDENSEAAKAGYATICEIGKERIRRAGKKLTETDGQVTLGEDEKAPMDVGFRVFKLDSSNLKQWDSSPLTGENAVIEFEQRLLGMLDILKPDRSDVDVVYEVMLKLGQDLCEPIVAIDLPNSRQVYGVGTDVKFIVCLALNITVEDAAIMADYAPGRIVFADQCFNSSEDKSNVKLTLRDKGITIKVL
jgi:adenine-specific DNA-methyltransferase